MAAASINLSTDREAVSRAWAGCIRRAGAGDAGALSELYDQTCRLVFGLAQRILGNHADAEEVTSDVYSYLWKYAANFDESRGSALAWIMVLTRSRAIDRLRARNQSLKRRQNLDVVSALPSGEMSAEAGLWAAQRRDIVRRALEALPSEQRTLLEAAYFDGLSHSELASQTNIPLGTVKTRLRMGMMKLRELLASHQEQSIR